MGCSMGHRAKAEVRKFQERGGYSTQEFVNDHLVPAEGFACVMPSGRDVEAMAALREELHDFSAACEEFYELQASGVKTGERKPEVPVKAFCLFRLHSIDIDTAGKDTVDLSKSDCRLKIRATGGVLVPRTAAWLSHPRGTVAEALTPAPPAYGEEMPMMLSVEVWLVVRQSNQIQTGQCQSGIVVQAKKVVFKTTGSHGDPMVESWFPIEDFLTSVTMAMTSKMRAAMEITDDHFMPS